MKTLSMVLTAAMVVFAGYAQDEATKDPKELERARVAYERETVRVLKPVMQDYLRTLEGLKRQYGVSGDAQAMMAAQKEIELVTAQLESGAPVTDWARGKWVYAANGANHYMRFDANNKYTWWWGNPEGPAMDKGTYRIISNTEVEVTVVEGPNKRTRILQLDKEGNLGSARKLR